MNLMPLFAAVMIALLSWLILVTLLQVRDAHKELFKTTHNPGFYEMFMYIEPRLLFRLAIYGTITITLLTLILTGSPGFTLLFAVIAVISPKVLLEYLKIKRYRHITEQLPDFLFAVSRSMQAGSSFNQALEIAISEEKGPIGEEFSLTLREVRVGADFTRSLNNLAVRVPVDEIRLVISAINISRETGGSLSETLHRISETLRQKLMMEGKIKALTAQGKLQGITMSILPFFVAVVLYRLEPVHMARLFTEPVGWFFLTLIFSMELFGFLFIRKIVSIDV